MTRLRNLTMDTPYIAWLRKQPALDSKFGYDREDVDIVWFRYDTGDIMIMEEKALSSWPTSAQRDTHGIIHQALEYSCQRIEFERMSLNRPRHLTNWGYHVIRLENFSPEDGRVFIDHARVEPEDLIKFHQFEFFPCATKVIRYGKEPITVRGHIPEEGWF